MKIYLAGGGYLKNTGDYLISNKVSRLFSYYDIESERVNMNYRFLEVINIKKELYDNLSGDMDGR